MTMGVAIDRLIDRAEEMDWRCDIYRQEHAGKTEQYIEFESDTPAGEDFIFTACGQTAREIAQDVFRYAEEFDLDEHVMSNLGAKGAPGVVTLVEDAKEIQTRLGEFAQALLEVVRK